MTPLRALNWALLVGIVVFALATYAGLPAEIPTGIGPNGEPRGVRQKSLLIWLALPGLTLVAHGLIEVLRTGLPRNPHWFNFPDKERFLRLPDEYKPPVIAKMQDTIDAVALSMLIILGLVQGMIWQTARGAPNETGMLVLMVGSIAFTPIILIVASRVTTATDEAEKRWKATDRSAA